MKCTEIKINVALNVEFVVNHVTKNRSIGNLIHTIEHQVPTCLGCGFLQNIPRYLLIYFHTKIKGVHNIYFVS